MRKHRWGWVAVLALMGSGGCAAPTAEMPSASEGTAVPQGQTTIVIDHRNSSVSSATIMLVPTSGGGRTVLGIVSFGDQRQFPVEVTGSQSYRLLAEGGPETLETRDFLLRPGDVVEWNLFSSAVSRR